VEIVNKEKIRQVAWIGDEYLKSKIRGVVLVFHGLGYYSVKNEPDIMELEWARAGWLVVFPYYGPWSWMNREARVFMNELVDAIYENYNLDADLPLVATGGSMGGLSSLLYTRYAKRTVSACLALFPVCDLEYHFSERADVPRGVYFAFRGYKEDIKKLFIEHSPLHQIPNMPHIPYLIVHGDADKSVNKENHSDKLVKKMKELDFDVEYIEVQGMTHGSLMPLHVLVRTIEFVNSIAGY
jgi:dipeptidyl aminopeptidase/acylaminoacyl peptidase